MPEVPGKDTEVIEAVPAEDAQAEVVDAELADALKVVGDATAGVGLTQTVEAPVVNGVVDLSGTDLLDVDTEKAMTRLLAAQKDVDL